MLIVLICLKNIATAFFKYNLNLKAAEQTFHFIVNSNRDLYSILKNYKVWFKPNHMFPSFKKFYHSLCKMRFWPGITIFF